MIRVGAKYMHNSGKGPYTVIAIATTTANVDRRMVIYKQEYDHEVYKKGHVWARDYEEFAGLVRVTKQSNFGVTAMVEIPRFSLLENTPAAESD